MYSYHGKKVLLASMHQKEQAIQPPFEEIIGCSLVVAKDFNTDQFGTFSGEVERTLSAFDTLKHKAVTAAKLFDFDYVVSSEGAFGPHPNSIFVNADTEMLLFYDRVNDLFISDFEISTDTNLADYELEAGKDYQEFLDRVLFPSHALIVKAGDKVIKKGITDRDELDSIISENLAKYKRLKLETDMRAMHNPSRMKVINRLAYKLAKRIITHCDECSTPGFGIESLSGYLLCELCGLPTQVKKYKDYKCIKCEYTKSELLAPDKKFADAKYCDFCNP